MNIKQLLAQLGITRFLIDEDPESPELIELARLMGSWPHAHTVLSCMSAVSSQSLMFGSSPIGYWSIPYLDHSRDSIMPPAAAIGLVRIGTDLSGDSMFLEPRGDGIVWFLDHESAFSLEGMDFEEASQLIKENAIPGLFSIEPFLRKTIADGWIDYHDRDFEGRGMIGRYMPSA